MEEQYQYFRDTDNSRTDDNDELSSCEGLEPISNILMKMRILMDHSISDRDALNMTAAIDEEWERSK